MQNHLPHIKCAPHHAGFPAEYLIVFFDFLKEYLAVILGVAVFGIGPGIECLFNDQDSPLTACLQEIPVCRIMGTADRIDSHLL